MNYTTILRDAAEYIDVHGWTQDQIENSFGEVCLTGAIRKCAPMPGDFYIVRAVVRAKGHGEEWNDAWFCTAAHVIAYLRTADITDADLAETFGPQWAEVVALVRRAPTLTKADAERLDAAEAAAWAARAAAWAAARAAAWAAAWAAARDAAWDARAAVVALVVRDLIGDTFTQAHYDTLTLPWRTVIGPIHPDDVDIPETGEK